MNLKPTQILVLGFLFIILIGTLILNLPISSNDGQSIGLLNALFTATSAVCVTGLAVVNTLEHWTMFGKIAILALIQIGGLGFMTITTTLFIILGKKISLKERLIIQEALNQYSLSGMVRLTKNVVLGTLLIEAIGAILLSIRFVPEYQWYGVFMGIFHSVSALCNAGFDIVGDSSLTPYFGDVLVNFTIMTLIVLGGLGFTVWLDYIKLIKDKKKYKYPIRRAFHKLSLHTKLVTVISVALIGVGFIFFLVVEGMNPDTLGELPFHERLLGSLFQSVTTRTAGFNTMNLSQMNNASKFMTIILMFIGGSPAGTSGGIKTVTFGIIFLAVVSVTRGRADVEAFNKRISWDIVKKALAVMVISITVVISTTMLLSLTEIEILNKYNFMDIFFEAVSGFGTVGLSLGITSELSSMGKLIMCFTMFIGRLGPITMMVAFTLKDKKRKTTIRNPEEKVMVG
ncbi:MAG: Trk family potassium uptake protein [Firmicutes bacterium HGW-Firmicutes-7]|nr:MAG: Trk family potassium uptake protein [Firmicutes bacterium HGW-Firmicutes-7]